MSQKADKKSIAKFIKKEDKSTHSKSTEKLKPECIEETVSMP